MSWIIQLLLNNREIIKSESAHNQAEYRYFPLYEDSMTEVLDDSNYERGYTDPRMESDWFNDLLTVEKAIKEMTAFGLLSNKEVYILDAVVNNKEVKYGRKYFFKIFYRICDKIAQYLGEYFTDDGYLDYMKKEYELTDKQIEILRTFMKSKHKNEIMRKSLDE